jgi:hypothetical protein
MLKGLQQVARARSMAHVRARCVFFIVVIPPMRSVRP